jgi:hypothetical protein
VPLSSAFSVSSIASRVSPVVAGVIVSRASHAASMAVSSWALDMGRAGYSRRPGPLQRMGQRGEVLSSKMRVEGDRGGTRTGE